MTGAGSGSLAFGKEQSFLGSLTTDGDSNPEYWQFGRNTAITELSMDTMLQRLDEEGAVESVESVKTGFEGAFAIESTISSDVHNDVEDLVFNDGGTQFKSGRPQTATIYTGVDYLDGTTERALEGCTPVDYSINYTEGGLLTYQLRFLYADETPSASITPTNVTEVSDGTSAVFHSLDLDIDGVDVSKLQDATLSISNISRFQRGGEGPTPVDVVIAAPETTLDATAIYGGRDRLDLAYGSAGASGPQDRLGSVPATWDITVDGTAVSTYNLAKIKPATYEWSDVINSGDTDTTDPTTFNVDGDPAVTVV